MRNFQISDLSDDGRPRIFGGFPKFCRINLWLPRNAPFVRVTFNPAVAVSYGYACYCIPSVRAPRNVSGSLW